MAYADIAKITVIGHHTQGMALRNKRLDVAEKRDFKKIKIILYALQLGGTPPPPEILAVPSNTRRRSKILIPKAEMIVRCSLLAARSPITVFCRIFIIVP